MPAAQEQLTPLVTETDLPFPVFRKGKVREVYEIGDDHLLMVATDRISAFDVILEPGIPDKGTCLTQISNFWFQLLEEHGIEHHIVTKRVEDMPEELHPYKDQLEGHAVLVEKLEPLEVECIVRGYITGSGWKDYKKTGEICGIPIKEGMQESEMFPEPLYTPSTKAAIGDHDENVSFEVTCDIVGQETAEWLRDTSLKIYKLARDYAAERGIILADTKFEFGRRKDGTIVLMDEVLTPDSSRFWPADQWVIGQSPPSFDKQIVRDYLETLDWNKTAPGPRLPDELVAKTSARYKEAFQKLTGKPFQLI